MKKILVISAVSFVFVFFVSIIAFFIIYANRTTNVQSEQKGYYYNYYSASDASNTSQLLFRITNKLNFGNNQNHDSFKDGETVNLISEFGDTNYKCSGNCYCEDEGRRNILNPSLLNKGLLFLVSAASLYFAIDSARSYFEEECWDKFGSVCKNVVADVEKCEDIDFVDHPQDRYFAEEDTDDSVEQISGKQSVLFVCRGNICRSPMCECIFDKLPKKKDWRVDSCATAVNYEFWLEHVKGNSPDKRTMKVLENRYPNSEFDHKSRGLTEEDFTNFDYILCMDDDNVERCNAMFKKFDFGGKKTAVIQKLADYSKGKYEVIPDPYKKDYEAFEEVYDMCKECCDDFLKEVEG